MTRCPGCGSQLAANARFCSLCGQGVAPPAATPTQQQPTQQMPPRTGQYQQPTGQYTQQPYAGQHPTLHPTGQYTTGQYPAGYPQQPAPSDGKGKLAVAAVVGGLIAALALFLLLKASGVLGGKQAEVGSGAVLTAPETKPVAAPVMAPPASKDNPMPEDVVRYLRWLKQFDAARRSMEHRGIAAYLRVPAMLTTQMMNEFDENNAGQPKPQRNEVADEIGTVVQKMNEATGVFQQTQPPGPCVPLGSAYLGALTSKTQQMSKLQGMVTQIFAAIDTSGNSNSQAQQMLPSLMAEMQNKTMSKEADAADTAASQALNALRSQYTSMPADVRDFDIGPVNTNLDPKSVIPPGMGFGM
jgi:hypothetical protein